MEKQFAGSQVEYLPIEDLNPDPRNLRTHSRRQIRMIRASLRKFGFVNPILINQNKRIIAGHGRWEAAKTEGHTTVPTILIEHLTEDQRRAYVIADNRLAEKAGWDKEILEIELQHLVAVGFEVDVTGFEVPEIDLIFDAAAEREQDPGPEDDAPVVRRDRPAVTRPGDLWLLGPKGDPRHRLLAGDARDPAAIARLMGDEQAAMVITDPPYNVPIKGHVSSKGRAHHKEFAMASGEMSEQEFIAFLKRFLAAALTRTAPGALLRPRARVAAYQHVRLGMAAWVHYIDQGTSLFSSCALESSRIATMSNWGGMGDRARTFGAIQAQTPSDPTAQRTSPCIQQSSPRR